MVEAEGQEFTVEHVDGSPPCVVRTERKE